MQDLISIAAKFRTEGSPLTAERTGSGHINDSYRIRMKGGGDYLLQRINHGIFKDIPALTENILRVTRHISSVAGGGSGNRIFEDLRLAETRGGEHYHMDEEGNFWRMFNFIAGSTSYDKVPGPDVAREAGKAFGLFMVLTAGLDVALLHETIPGFHDIEGRLLAFRKVVLEDPAGRAGDVADEIAFFSERGSEMHKIRELGEKGLIPLRVTHNDTKINNILFGPGGRALCIVDLDTVMPGYILYDFGDAIRTGASTAAEDEEDPERINIDLGLFEAYSSGFLEPAGKRLVDLEKQMLAFSARFMTYIIGLRFLTDHIAGDTYYRIHFPGHNLRRTRAQMKLLRSMEENAAAMEKIISDLCKRTS